MTGKEKILGSALGVVWLGGFAAVWQVAAPTYSDANKARIFLCYLAIGIVLLLWAVREGRGRRMSFVAFLIWGMGLGLCAGLIVWGMFAIAENSPPDVLQDSQTNPSKAEATDKNPASLWVKAGTTPLVVVSPLIPDPDQKPADQNDLKFYFFAVTAAADGGIVQYADVTMTNRSPRKMHLTIWGNVDYWKDNGEAARISQKAEWEPDGFKERTGQTTVDMDPWETKRRHLLLFLDNPEKHGVQKWFVDPSENVYFEAFDSVTGKRIAFKGMSGYPADQMPAPLPPHKDLLALEFPEPIAKVDAAPEVLDVVVRTRGKRLSDTKAALDVLVTNFAAKSMELEFKLLMSNLVVENNWVAADGLVNGARTLSVEPGATIDNSVSFDLAALGVPKTGGWSLKDDPKETLIEIHDRQSGKKVWCAFLVGYPPAADLRAATFISKDDIEKSGADSR